MSTSETIPRIPEDLPHELRERCEPCRALPRAPGTFQRAVLGDEPCWGALRARRAVNKVRWKKRVKGTPRAEHVDALIARFDEERPPSSLLAPEVEATWMWLELDKVDADEALLIVDFWVARDPSRAVENLVAYAGFDDADEDKIGPVRRLRAHLSVVGEEAWAQARSTASRLAEGASRRQACLLAYLFPEDAERANRLVPETKPRGYERLVVFSVTDAELSKRLVQSAENAWELLHLEQAVPAWVAIALGPRAQPVLEILSARWPKETAHALGYVRGIEAPAASEDFFSKYEMPMNGGRDRNAWFDGIEQWLHDWAHGAVEAGGWTREDGDKVWPELLDDIKDNGLDLTKLSAQEVEPLEKMFMELFPKVLEAHGG